MLLVVGELELRILSLDFNDAILLAEQKNRI